VVFLGSDNLQNFDANRCHEPLDIPLNRPAGTFSPTGGEGWDEGVRCMESFHVPEIAQGMRRRILFWAKPPPRHLGGYERPVHGRPPVTLATYCDETAMRNLSPKICPGLDKSDPGLDLSRQTLSNPVFGKMKLRTMKSTLQKLAPLLVAAVICFSEKTEAVSRLKVSENKHFLVKEDGSPFFYLGDTAWELFHRLNREDADFYLTNRAAKGFTVIQAVALAEFDGLTVTNAYGHLPLANNDPTKPNEPYFQHVDYVVNKAEKLGLYVGILPTWGDKWNKKRGVGPEIFTPANAEVYGEFLGKRYKDKAVLWILGGDRNPDNDRHLEIIRAMAKGLRKGDGGNHLITFHPSGAANSSQWFHSDAWLDFNMIQSGHGATNIPNYEAIGKNYTLTPPKPTLDGEPRYEDHPINWKPADGWFDDWDVRQAAYWSLLAGACGHTYGNHDIWQFLQPDRKAISSARTPWKKAIDHPGAAQMGYARKLFESRPYQTLVPAPAVLVDDPGAGADRILAARAEDGGFIFIYSPTGQPITVHLGKIPGSRINAFWFDPRTGQSTSVGLFPSLGSRKFEPASHGRGNDWVLVLDDASKGFANPGELKKK
jgi:hypothetical protein